MARLSRKHKNAIIKVINKWRDAYAGNTPVNYDRIRELIKIAYKKKTRQVRVKARNGRIRWQKVKLDSPTIHILRSPVAFDIAQAVCRGRLGKKDAEALCDNYGIDKSFVESLRRDHMTDSFGRHHWHRGSSAMLDLWNATLGDSVTAAQDAAFNRPPDPETEPRGSLKVRQYRQFAPSFPDLPGLSRNQKIREIKNNDPDMLKPSSMSIGPDRIRAMKAFTCKDPGHAINQQLLDVPRSSSAHSATLSRCERAAIGGYDTNYIEAELVCELMGITDITQRWAYELMRQAHVTMFFAKQALVLAESPTVRLNADGELHNDEGPAVYWADGAKQYYIDGHELGYLGELIVEKPEQLTLEHINGEENEEIKRLAIERYGWGRYLENIGATVVDRRENAVDNTIEALVAIRTKIYRRSWRSATPEEVTLEQRKLILSCRSTARQYFLAVPETVKSCEEGQRWMAESASTTYVPALNHRVRVIGAS